jgi:hypothetical protein
MVSRIALEYLGQDRLGAGETDQLRILVERDAHGARLLGERLQDCLTNPPDRVRDELHALVRIELANGLEQSFVADRDELTQVEPVALVLLHVGDHEPEVRGHQALGGGFVSFLRQPGESSLFGRVGDQRQLLDVVQVLIESG